MQNAQGGSRILTQVKDEVLFQIFSTSGEVMYVLTIDMKQHSVSYNSSGTVALVAHHFLTILYKLRMANVQKIYFVCL